MNKTNLRQMEADIEWIERELQHCCRTKPETNPQAKVLEAMRYSLEAGGKRIRPLLVLAFCRACGGDVQKALKPALAIEMIHTYSLIHDDLPAMDDDDYRRGRLSCHKAFDEATAILAGDALNVLPFELLSTDTTLPAETRVSLIAELANAAGAEGMIGGQVIDGAAVLEDALDVVHAVPRHHGVGEDRRGDRHCQRDSHGCGSEQPGEHVCAQDRRTDPGCMHHGLYGSRGK